MLQLILRHHPDGAYTLSCTRSDGSCTWRRYVGRHAIFFPAHDLTHYAAESVLGCRGGFYGLLAQGWTLEQFGDKVDHTILPEEALAVELLVGFLDQERNSGELWTADDFADHAAAYAKARQLPAVPVMPGEDELARIRTLRDTVLAQWRATPPGGDLALTFGIAVEASA